MKDKLSRIFKGIIAVGGFTGLYLHLDFLRGAPPAYKFMHFTVISNIIVTVIYFLLLANPKISQNRSFLRFKGAVIMMITVTGVVYNTILKAEPYTAYDLFMKSDVLGNFIVHVFIPVCVVADWLIFDKKGCYKIYDPLLWTLFPYAYVIFTVVVAHIGQFYPNQESRYPYNFMAWDVYGFSAVFKNIVLMSVFFIVLGYIFYFVGYLLGKKKNKC